MIGYFKERNTFQVPALLFLALVLKLTFIYHPHYDSFSQPGGLLAPWLANSVFPRLRPSFVASLSIIIIFFSGLYANYLFVHGRMFHRSNMLVALSMLMFTSLFPSSNQLSAATFMLPVLILLFQQITRLYNAQKVRPIIINIGMIMGASYLLYHPFLWIIPCCFFALGGMRTFRLAEWLLLIAGFVTPVYFLLAYEFVSGQWHPMRHLIHWKLYTHVPTPNTFWWIAIGVVVVWLFAGFAGWQKQMRRMLIQSRKNWYQLLFIGVFILPMVVLPRDNVSEAITLLSFPAGALAANAFENQEKTVGPLLLFWFIITAVIVVGWGYIR